LADSVNGVITARAGNTLTLRGLYVDRGGVLSYADSIPVTIGPSTVVSKDGVVASGLSAASPSIGQKVTLFGQGAIGTSGAISVDATLGQVRLATTRVWGALNSATAGSLSMNALTFDNFAPSGLNFAGAASAGQTIDPAAYAVNTGALDATAISAGS